MRAILVLVGALLGLFPATLYAQVDPKLMLVGAGIGLTVWAGEQMDKTPPLPTAGERSAADVVSWATSLAPVALDARESWQCADRARCFEMQGVRTAVVYGAMFVTKRFIHRNRPCAPDCGHDNPAGSFFSGHTAIAFSTVGGPSLAVTLPLSIVTGGLRVAAGKHFVTDTIAGALVGLGASRIR